MKLFQMVVFCGILITTSCNPYKLTSTWKADNITHTSFKKILVLGLINEPDRTVRENMENELVKKLTELGYSATCSCDEFGPKSFEDMKEQEALAKLGNSGIDAVLTIVLLDNSKERYYVPGRVYYSPYYYQHHRFWGYYNTMYGRIYSPGYYVTNTSYFWESNLYSVNGNSQLLYSAQSRSFDPPNTIHLTTEYSEMIVKNMLKAGVLSNQSGKKLAF